MLVVTDQVQCAYVLTVRQGIEAVVDLEKGVSVLLSDGI